MPLAELIGKTGSGTDLLLDADIRNHPDPGGIDPPFTQFPGHASTDRNDKIMALERESGESSQDARQGAPFGKHSHLFSHLRVEILRPVNQTRSLDQFQKRPDDQ